MSGYSIERATMADRPRIIQFLRDAFYKYEPLNNAMGLTEDPTDADIDHSLQSLPQGNSLIAVSPDNRILGVALNGEITDRETDIRQKLYEECKCEDFGAFLKFWVYIEKRARVFENRDVKKALDLEIMAVDPATRGQGIGKAMIDRTKLLAKEVGYEMFRMDCSSYYAGKLAEMQGMECVFEMNYDDYKDEAGRTIFKIPPPHTALRIFVQRL